MYTCFQNETVADINDFCMRYILLLSRSTNRSTPLSDVSVILDNTPTVEHGVPTDEKRDCDDHGLLASIQVIVELKLKQNESTDHSERDTNPSVDRSVDTFLYYFGKLSVLDETEHGIIDASGKSADEERAVIANRPSREGECDGSDNSDHKEMM